MGSKYFTVSSCSLSFLGASGRYSWGRGRHATTGNAS